MFNTPGSVGEFRTMHSPTPISNAKLHLFSRFNVLNNRVYLRTNKIKSQMFPQTQKQHSTAVIKSALYKKAQQFVFSVLIRRGR